MGLKLNSNLMRCARAEVLSKDLLKHTLFTKRAPTTFVSVKTDRKWKVLIIFLSPNLSVDSSREIHTVKKKPLPIFF